MIKKSVTVQIPEKTDAKPVAMLVQMASRYHSAIYLKNSKYNVNAKSIMGMMLLGFSHGEEIQVTADGADEVEAVNQIERYLSCVN